MPVFDRYQKIKSYLLGSQDPNELAALQAEEELAQDTRNVAGIGSGVDKIISAIGGTQANPEPYLQMQKTAGEGPARVREYLKQKYQQQQAAGQTAATMASAEEQADATRQKQAADAAREAAKGTPGQQELEKEVGKSVAQWESGGRNTVETGLKNLELAAEELKGMKPKSGEQLLARGGYVSDRMLKVKQKILKAALPTAQEVLKGTMSDKDITALVEGIVDPRLSPEDNYSNITSTISDWKTKKLEKDAQSAKFRGVGPPQGLSGPPSVPTGMKLQQNKKTGEYRVVPK